MLEVLVLALAVGVVFLGPGRASATLIIVIPARDGVVIAADSRGFVASSRDQALREQAPFVDTLTKVHVVQTVPTFAFAFTGDCRVWSPGGGPFVFESANAVNATLGKVTPPILTEDVMNIVASHLAESFRELFRKGQADISVFAGCGVVVVQSLGAT